MKLQKAERRERKQRKRRHGQREDGRSNFLIQRIIIEKAEQIRKEKDHEPK